MVKLLTTKRGNKVNIMDIFRYRLFSMLLHGITHYNNESGNESDHDDDDGDDSLLCFAQHSNQTNSRWMTRRKSKSRDISGYYCCFITIIMFMLTQRVSRTQTHIATTKDIN